MNSEKTIIYSQQSTGYIKGQCYANPRFFSTPRSDVEKVFVVGDWPKIHEAYEAIGVPVERLDVDSATAKPEPVKPPVGIVSRLTADERGAVSIPENWRDLGWTKAEEGSISLRALATSLSDTPILNKADAGAAIEAELSRRAAAASEPEA